MVYIKTLVTYIGPTYVGSPGSLAQGISFTFPFAKKPDCLYKTVTKEEFKSCLSKS